MKIFKKINFGKILAIVFLTVLIWIWADLMLDDTFNIPSTLSVSKSIDPSLWVSLSENEKQNITIEQITLKASASNLGKIKQKINNGSINLNKFFFDPSQQDAVTGSFDLDLKDYLQKTSEIKQLGLTIESCKPQTIRVNIVKLVEKHVKIDCIDEYGNIIKDAAIEPSHVDMFVPDYGSRELVNALVKLTTSQIESARLVPNIVKPYVVLAPGQNKEAEETVNVSIFGPETKLETYSITPATIGYVFSGPTAQKYNLEYHAEFLNLADLTTVNFRATQAAKEAYEKQPYKILIYILDEDKALPGKAIERQVVYNFPSEFVEKKEIAPIQLPVTAKFKLTEISAPVPATTPVP
jgi:hypothetical protein